MPHLQRKPTREFADLTELVHILRAECPWDKQQTHDSVKDLLIEETYEAVDAIDRADFNDLCKELGDVLLHVIFHSEMAAETSSFTIEDVIYRLQEKLIRRHPHIFDTVTVDNTHQVLKNWESIKMKEKPKSSVLDGVPPALPGLLRAERMQEKATLVGFDWPSVEGAWEKLSEEIQEFRTAAESGNAAESRAEFGDLLFSLVNVARFYQIHPEEALRLTNAKFQRRFNFVEKSLAEDGLPLHEAGLAKMDELWNKAKELGL